MNRRFVSMCAAGALSFGGAMRAANDEAWPALAVFLVIGIAFFMLAGSYLEGRA